MHTWMILWSSAGLGGSTLRTYVRSISWNEFALPDWKYVSKSVSSPFSLPGTSVMSSVEERSSLMLTKSRLSKLVLNPGQRRRYALFLASRVIITSSSPTMLASQDRWLLCWRRMNRVEKPSSGRKNAPLHFGSWKKHWLNPPVLRSPNFDLDIIVQTVASDFAIGAVLSQKCNDEEHRVAYFSRKLSPRELKYSAVEKECLAIKLALKSSESTFWDDTFWSRWTTVLSRGWTKFSNSNARLTRLCLALQAYSFLFVMDPEWAMEMRMDFPACDENTNMWPWTETASWDSSSIFLSVVNLFLSGFCYVGSYVLNCLCSSLFLLFL